MLTRKEKVKDKEFREKYNSIFEILSFKDERALLLEPFISVTRVLIFTAVLVFL
jgi:2-oxo-4-hydroxy-4-carboxy--5-ureidoimidazoline (OHCU) decarboxylase